MNYVLKTELPKYKSTLLALTAIYGVGHSKSLFICKKLGFLPNFKVVNMSDYHWQNLLKSVETLVTDNAIELGPDLKSLTKQNERDLISLNLYRGSRLKKGLPSRGQRTHSNAQTAGRFVDKSQRQQQTKKKTKQKKKLNKKK